MKMNSSLYTIFAAAVFALLIQMNDMHLYAAQTDGRIELYAKKSYIFKTFLKGDHIKVNSDDGVVTLTGTVSEDSHRAMAEETLLNMEGVKSVDNKLSAKSPHLAPYSDAWISERVKYSLLIYCSDSYANTDFVVTGGKVTLTGKASNRAQRQLTTEYVLNVSGVKGVDNQMVVKSASRHSKKDTGRNVDDASITTQVNMSFLYYHGTAPFDTKVSTLNGVVTLTGTACDQAEIDSTTKRVKDINGVESVDNKMTIEATQTSTN
jgi:osmotically-inducible protein OsmY